MAPAIPFGAVETVLTSVSRSRGRCVRMSGSTNFSTVRPSLASCALRHILDSDWMGRQAPIPWRHSCPWLLPLLSVRRTSGACHSLRGRQPGQPCGSQAFSGVLRSLSASRCSGQTR